MSRKGFMHSTTPLNTSPSSTRVNTWETRLKATPPVVTMRPGESLSAGSDRTQLCWRSHNRLYSRVGCTKTNMKKWGYFDVTRSTQCDCGEKQTVPYLSAADCWMNRVCPKTWPLSWFGQRHAPRNCNRLCEDTTRRIP